MTTVPQAVAHGAILAGGVPARAHCGRAAGGRRRRRAACRWRSRGGAGTRWSGRRGRPQAAGTAAATGGGRPRRAPPRRRSGPRRAAPFLPGSLCCVLCSLAAWRRGFQEVALELGERTGMGSRVRSCAWRWVKACGGDGGRGGGREMEYADLRCQEINLDKGDGSGWRWTGPWFVHACREQRDQVGRFGRDPSNDYYFFAY